MDLYQLFDTFTHKIGVSKMSNITTNIADPMLKIFANPVYFANHTATVAGKNGAKMNEVISHQWDFLLSELQKTSVKIYNEADFQKLNPSDLMFLGNLDAIADNNAI